VQLEPVVSGFDHPASEIAENGLNFLRVGRGIERILDSSPPPALLLRVLVSKGSIARVKVPGVRPLSQDGERETSADDVLGNITKLKQ
jgi:hypothetical protein